MKFESAQLKTREAGEENNSRAGWLESEKEQRLVRSLRLYSAAAKHFASAPAARPLWTRSWTVSLTRSVFTRAKTSASHATLDVCHFGGSSNLFRSFSFCAFAAIPLPVSPGRALLTHNYVQKITRSHQRRGNQSSDSGRAIH